MTKDEMEAAWQSRKIINPKAPSTLPGVDALAFRRRALCGHDFPAFKFRPPGGWPMEPSAELKARYKADCPNNYKALIASYGKTRTKYDAPLPSERIHTFHP